MPLIEANAREIVTKREKILKKKLIALLKDDGRGHKHAKYAARLEDFIVKIVSLEDDPTMTAAISFEDATIYISEGFLKDSNTFYQLNVLMRHELAHYLMQHQIRMMKLIIEKYGKEGYTRIKMSQSIHTLFNILDDFEISNTRYSKADKEIVRHMILNCREIGGLVTEDHRENWLKLSVIEMYAKLEEEMNNLNKSILAIWDQQDLQSIGKSKDYIHSNLKNIYKMYIDTKSPTNFLGPVEQFLKNKALYHFTPFDRITNHGVKPCMVIYSSLTDIYKSIIKDIYDIVIKGDENGKEYKKQFVRDKINEIAKSNIIEIISIKFTSADTIKLYTPEEKLLAIDTLKAMLPILQEYETWYEKVTRVLGDTSKYSKEDLKKVLAALEQ